jgi:uncharacterized protein
MTKVLLFQGLDVLADWLFLAISGFVTGLIDSIAGGGGLISVPAYMLVLGTGVEAVATNKISALASTLTALYIYQRNGFVQIKLNKYFLLLVFTGAICGAGLSRYMPPAFYKYMMVLLIPFVLFVLFQKKLWTENQPTKKPQWILCILGFSCGVYDGIAGPGGGTLMFLSLFVFGGLPLHLSIGTAKLANVFSASSSLVTYVALGKVDWLAAVPATTTIMIGAYIGAKYATKNAVFYARLALVIVSVLMLLKLVTTEF